MLKLVLGMACVKTLIKPLETNSDYPLVVASLRTKTIKQYRNNPENNQRRMQKTQLHHANINSAIWIVSICFFVLKFACKTTLNRQFLANYADNLNCNNDRQCAFLCDRLTASLMNFCQRKIMDPIQWTMNMYSCCHLMSLNCLLQSSPAVLEWIIHFIHFTFFDSFFLFLGIFLLLQYYFAFQHILMMKKPSQSTSVCTTNSGNCNIDNNKFWSSTKTFFATLLIVIVW